MRQEFQERRVKEMKEAADSAEKVLREKGVDPETGRRTVDGRTRSRAGAPNVSPGSGFDQAFQKDAQDVAQSAKGVTDATKLLADAQKAANSENTALLQQLAAELRSIRAQLASLRTTSSTYR